MGWQARAGAIIGYFAGALIEILGSIASIYATAQLGALLARFAANGQAPHIWWWLWLDIAAGAITALGFVVMSYYRRLAYFSLTRRCTAEYMAALCRIDIADYYDKDIRNQINKVSSGFTWQMSGLLETVIDLIYGVLRFIAITIIVAQIGWWVVPLIAIFLVPTLLAENKLAKIQWFVWDEKGDQRHIFWGIDWILRQVKGQMEVRSSQAAKYLLAKINTMNQDFYTTQERRFRQASRIVVPTKLLESAGTAIGAVAVLRQFLTHSISLDRYFFLSGALLRIGGSLNTIFGTLGRMQEPLLFANSYFDLIDTKPRLVDLPSNIILTPETPEIVFENVSFSYPGQTKPVFTKLNLQIPAGEHIAIVGENGAGKSTLIKLLLRFYRPTAGRILVDGQDLQSVNIESWYSQLATLFQDFNQYPLPVGENITIGRSQNRPDKKLRNQAAVDSGVGEMVDGYEYGWRTVLDSSFSKGIEPSGGQWQRVALARAFYRQSNVLILDEPTAAIDAKAEYKIFNNIFDRYLGKTAIIVSHRFSTVRRADKIVVIDKGKIVEQGTHTELIKLQGLYHEMFSKQAEGYKT